MPGNIGANVVAGDDVTALSYNTIQSKIATIMGAGSGQSGYGQAVASSQVTSGVSLIDDADWDNLRSDLLKARQHQTGVDESAGLTDVTVGNAIDDAVHTQYNNFADVVVANKFAMAANQASVVTTNTYTWPGAWNNYALVTIPIIFPAGAQSARYFFNSGGTILLNTSIPGGGAKNDSWATMLAEVGTVTFGAAGFYAGNNTLQQLVAKGAAAGVYVENRFYLSVQVFNDNPTANGSYQISFTFRYEDNDLGDQTGTGPAVDENVNAFSISVQARYASGSNVAVSPPTHA